MIVGPSIRVIGYMCNCDETIKSCCRRTNLCAWPRNVRLSLEHSSVEPAKMLFGDVGGGDLSPLIHFVSWCKVRRVGSLPMCSPRSCGVPPQVSGASRSAKKCSSRAVEHTHATGDSLLLDWQLLQGSLRATARVSRDLVVCRLLLIRPLVPMLLWCMGRV